MFKLFVMLSFRYSSKILLQYCMRYRQCYPYIKLILKQIVTCRYVFYISYIYVSKKLIFYNLDQSGVCSWRLILRTVRTAFGAEYYVKKSWNKCGCFCGHVKFFL